MEKINIIHVSVEDGQLKCQQKEIAPGDYCEVGMSRCVNCGWRGDYPVSGCPNCNRSFVE